MAITFLELGEIKNQMGRRLVNREIESEESELHFRVLSLTPGGCITRRTTPLKVLVTPTAKAKGEKDKKRGKKRRARTGEAPAVYHIMTEEDFKFRVHFPNKARVKLVA